MNPTIVFVTAHWHDYRVKRSWSKSQWEHLLITRGASTANSTGSDGAPCPGSHYRVGQTAASFSQATLGTRLWTTSYWTGRERRRTLFLLSE
jgi:hypothetical protein